MDLVFNKNNKNMHLNCVINEKNQILTFVIELSTMFKYIYVAANVKVTSYFTGYRS